MGRGRIIGYFSRFDPIVGGSVTPPKKARPWERARMREVSPKNSLTCTRTASSSWTSTRMESLTKTISVEPSTTLVSSCLSLSLMASLERSADPAPTTTWSRCSRRRWPVRATTPMTWGDKMTKDEIDDIFGEFDIDEDYMVKTKEVLGLFVAQKEEEK